MIRGYQKKIIFLKNINSRIFDQAQFIVSCENERKYSKREMMAEANRIIEENFDIDGKRKRRLRGFLKILKYCLIPLVIGVGCGIFIGYKIWM